MHQTIYIRKSNWDRFKDEADKSRLVNELLEKYYGPATQVAEKKLPKIPGVTTASKITYQKKGSWGA